MGRGEGSRYVLALKSVMLDIPFFLRDISLSKPPHIYNIRTPPILTEFSSFLLFKLFIHSPVLNQKAVYILTMRPHPLQVVGRSLNQLVVDIRMMTRNGRNIKMGNMVSVINVLLLLLLLLWWWFFMVYCCCCLLFFVCFCCCCFVLKYGFL